MNRAKQEGTSAATEVPMKAGSFVSPLCFRLHFNAAMTHPQHSDDEQATVLREVDCREGLAEIDEELGGERA